ncbi:hypothetical protein RFN66_18805 [Bacillus paralicheniformis]|uniref:hypothetical protein n=1 Tax=Bacillus paralicheniformis TaxID=1648923 RepID=UPI0028680B4B|nr:hypothetical protein [Bacillus paralicheniformis]WMW46651.1 hypothetical protein RFN66_18805 [Bacillus paralicheniformis]
MKKYYMSFIALLAALMLLVACSNNETSSSRNEKSSQKSEAEGDSLKTDGPLKKVGQWKTEKNGTKVTLKKIAKVNKTFNLDPITMNLDEIKIIERSNLQASDKELLKEKGIKSNKFLTIQFTYNIENKSDQEILFQGIKIITTNTKKQIDASRDDMIQSREETGTGIFHGQVRKEGYIVVPCLNTNPDDLNYINIKIGNVLKNEDASILHEGITEKINF